MSNRLCLQYTGLEATVVEAVTEGGVAARAEVAEYLAATSVEAARAEVLGVAMGVAKEMAAETGGGAKTEGMVEEREDRSSGRTQPLVCGTQNRRFPGPTGRRVDLAAHRKTSGSPTVNSCTRQPAAAAQSSHRRVVSADRLRLGRESAVFGWQAARWRG